MTNIHDTVGRMFTRDKQINDDYHSSKEKDIFILSASSVQRLIDTVDVYKSGQSSNYSKYYNLPKVTEKNKDAILMHFVSNINAGEASKGYLDNNFSLKRFATDNTREPEFIIPNVPGVAEAKKKIENAKKAVKPKIGLGTRIAGYWQKLFGMDKPARRAYDEYHQKLNEYNSLKNVKNEEALISKYESVTMKNESMVTEEFAKVKETQKREAEKYKQAQKQEEMFASNSEKWDHYRFQVTSSISTLKKMKMKDDFPNYARDILKDMKGMIDDMQDSKKAQKEYDALEKDFQDALKKQETLKGKVNKIDDSKLSEKLGMQQKNTQGSKKHVGKSHSNDLENSLIS